MLKADKLIARRSFGLFGQKHALIRLGRKHALNAVRGCRSLAEHHEYAVDAHDSLHDHVEIGQESQNNARLHGARVHTHSSHPDNQRQTDVQAHLHKRAGDRHDRAGCDVRMRHFVVVSGKAALFILRF